MMRERTVVMTVKRVRAKPRKIAEEEHEHGDEHGGI